MVLKIGYWVLGIAYSETNKKQETRATVSKILTLLFSYFFILKNGAEQIFKTHP